MARQELHIRYCTVRTTPRVSILLQPQALILPAPTADITNDVVADGFSESLNASIGGATGAATSTGGEVGLMCRLCRWCT